jgi:hypothetical protein
MAKRITPFELTLSRAIGFLRNGMSSRQAESAAQSHGIGHWIGSR